MEFRDAANVSFRCFCVVVPVFSQLLRRSRYVVVASEIVCTAVFSLT